MIIDFHTHIFNDNLAKRAISLLEEKGNIKAYLNGTIADILNSMDNAGINISVVHPVITKPSQTEPVNTWAASIQSDRIISFAGIHPEDENYKMNIANIKKMGFKGIKMHPDYQDFFVDDPKMYKIYDAIFENELILLLHAGLDIGFPAPYHCTPPRLAKVLDTLNGGTIIAAHLGGHMMWDDVENYLAGRNIYFDTSMGLEYYKLEQFLSIVEAHGSDKILFGSDSPWSEQKDELTRIKNAHLIKEDMDNILFKNASLLLGLNNN